MLAKIVAMVCALYWGVTNKKRSAGIGAYYARGTGIEVYARAWADGPFQALCGGVRGRAVPRHVPWPHL